MFSKRSQRPNPVGPHRPGWRFGAEKGQGLGRQEWRRGTRKEAFLVIVVRDDHN